LLIFKGAHEIAALSWFFFIKGKEQKIKFNMNPSKNRKLQNSNLRITPQLLSLITFNLNASVIARV